MKTATLKNQRPNLTTARRGRRAKTIADTLKIKNVLVPLDFSIASHTAIQFASPLLKRFGANLHLVHVMPADSMSGLADMPMVMPEIEFGRTVRRDLRTIARDHGLPLQRSSFHARRGTPFAEICELARKIPAELIVISTRGNTGLKHLALGSTAERVVRYSPCPVLVVRAHREGKPSANGNAQGRADFKKILVPIDFSECSLRGLDYGKMLAKEFGASLVLLHSVHLQYYVSSDEYARYDFPLLMQQAEKAAREQMRDLVRKTDWDGTKVEPSLQVGHAGDQVCERAKDFGADLIVTSTHGTTGLKHILLGSTAEFIVRHAPCPVLVVPSNDVRRFIN